MLTFYPLRAIVCVCSLLFALSTNVDAQCGHPDYPALESLFSATDGNNWTDKSGWLTDCEPCGWAGIGCDADNRVTSINLRANGLNGTIPAGITDLDRLEMLALNRNQLSGNLPAGLFSMVSLKDINLSRNALTGNIPATLGNQGDLEYLRLADNQLTGAIPSGIAALTQLRIVMLENNDLSGAMPEGLGDFPNLITLNLTDNDLEGCFPNDLTALCSQSRIMFGGNDKMSWKGDFSRLCAGSFDEAQIGAPCDDGDPTTGGDAITQDCGCFGGVTDGVGLVGSDGFTVEDALSSGDVDPPLSPLQNANAPVLTTAPAIYEVTVYPNPVIGNELTVSLPSQVGPSNLRLLSATGRVLLSQVAEGNSTLVRLPVLEAGIYLVEVITAGNRTVKRVIVQR